MKPFINTKKLYQTMTLLLFTLFLAVACAPATGNEPAAQVPTEEPTEQPATEEPTTESPIDGEQLTMFVDAEQVDCVGVAPQKCLRIKFGADEEWQLLYSGIEGFNYEPGFEYELLVNKTEVENPPADASSIRYTLIEEVSKTALRIDPSAPPALGDAIDLNGTSWILSGILVGGDAMTTTEFDSEITLNFADGQANGSAGCNSYFAQYVQDGHDLTFNGIGQTEMACMETERMDRESQFLEMLSNTGRYMVNGNTLTFLHQDGNYPTLVFTDANTAAVTELDGTSWTLAGILVGGDAMTSSEVDQDITLNFDNGEVNGSAGCNSYFSSYTVNGDTLTIDLIGSTMMACEEERMNRETEFLTALGNIGRFAIADNQLTLFHKEGDYPVLVFDLAEDNMEAATLEDTQWVLNGIVIGGDAVSGSAVDENITATFSEGQMAGSAGCNNYFASYEIEGESLTLGPAGSTKKLCTDELVMERENEFLSALANIGSYTIEDGMLTLFDTAGLPLLMFVTG